MSNSYLKPLITGAVAVAGDKFIFQETDLNKSLYFGGAVALGTYAGNVVGSMLPAMIPSGGFVNGKTLEVITRYPNERWQADLIDVEAYAKDNHNHKYILTIIDNFSKYVFAKGLVKRDAVSILEAFEDIIENQALHTYPKIIQTDNGGEFKNKTFQDWAKLNDIKLKLSLSHKLTSNALIENLNNIEEDDKRRIHSNQ